MGYIIFTVFIVLLFAGLSVLRDHFRKEAVARSSNTRRDASDMEDGARICQIARFVVIGVFALITLMSSLTKVDNGHVGLVYTFGKITGQRGSGLVITFPWQDVKGANVQIQSLTPETKCLNGIENCMDAFSNESQDVFVSATINIHVSPDKIQGLYRDVGPDYIHTLILPRLAQITKEETVKYAAKEVAPHRQDLRNVIAQRMTSDLSAHSIIVDDFLLTNVDFDQAFKDAVSQSVVAEQNAQTAKNQVEVSKAQADQAVAVAQGQADAQVVAAKGQAEANTVITESLTPELIEYTAVQKLNPNVKVMIVPQGNGFILNMGGVLDDTAAAPDTGS